MSVDASASPHSLISIWQRIKQIVCDLHNRHAPVSQTELACTTCQASAEALYALHDVCFVTQPDRAALERIFREEHLCWGSERIMEWATKTPLKREDLDRLWQEHDHQYRSAEAWKQAMKDAIWAWVCGTPTTPRWCQHMLWNDGDGTHLRGWYYQQFPDQMLEAVWDQCPVSGCHAPRPTPTPHPVAQLHGSEWRDA